jgi:hypothetical protein
MTRSRPSVDSGRLTGQKPALKMLTALAGLASLSLEHNQVAMMGQTHSLPSPA